MEPTSKAAGSSKRPIALCIAGFALLLALVFVPDHSSRRALKLMNQVAPDLSARIKAEVDGLKAESLTKSLQELSNVDMFYWPGAPKPGYTAVSSYVPLAQDVGQSDIEAIMSNRRFRKILSELSKLDIKVCSQMVRRELEHSIPEYLAMYEADLKRMAPHYPASTNTHRPFIVGPVFAMQTSRKGRLALRAQDLKSWR
jgi:hypothetical protein